MFKPEVEDVGINIGFGQPHAQQNPGGERPDDIDPAFGIPVMLPGAALSTRCIPIGTGHVMGKTTLVDIDNGPGIALIGINLFPKPLPRVQVCFRGRQGFFICHARFAKRLPYGLRCHIKPRSAIVLAGVGMVYHLLRKLLRVDLSDLPTLAGPGSNPPGPTLDRSNANRKPLRGFSKAQAFLLSYRKNMPTKGYRICHNK